MATYDNPRTGVVHWIYRPGECWPTTTACCYLNNQMASWKRENVDRVGAPADVTCIKCQDTAVWLDAMQAERGDPALEAAEKAADAHCKEVLDGEKSTP